MREKIKTALMVASTVIITLSFIISYAAVTIAIQTKDTVDSMETDIQAIKAVYNIEYLRGMEQDVQDLQDLAKAIQKDYSGALSQSVKAMSSYIIIGNNNKESIDGLSTLLEKVQLKLKQLEDNTRGGAKYEIIYEGEIQ